MVDYRRNLGLAKDGVSFHFCEEDSTSMHYHNFYEFFVITHGKTRHELNGEVSYLSKNTLYMIRPEDRHQFTKLPGFDCVHMNICVTCDRLAKICGGLGVSVSELAAGKSMTLTLSERDMAFFTERAHQIGLVRRSPSGNPAVIEYELVAETVSQLNKARLFSDIARYPGWFCELLEKVHSPEYLSCTAADIYRLGGCSPPVMIGCFKEYTGKTVAGYLRDYKLGHACEMLKNTRLTSLEISSLLGYDSLSHFSRIFKQHTGFSPGRYRRGKTIN
jgi:AraC family cel operon transcriptional repressor